MLRSLLLLLLALRCLSGVAEAASHDPSLTWRTLTTPHFHVTFHGGEERHAEEVANAAELVYAEMTAEMKWKPRRRTEIVLVDESDGANGFAFTLPQNTIVLYVTAPTEDSTLSQYDNWTLDILTHEFTHILHLDTTGGIPAGLRKIFGRIIGINNSSPRWVVEGLATFQETRSTMTGRGRSTHADMVKRMTALENRFPPLGNLDGWQVAPPGGNLRYLFGQDFIQFVSDRTGRDVWTDFAHMYGSGVPYWLPSRRAFGATLTSLYFEWKEAFLARYAKQKAEVEALGLSPFRTLNDPDQSCGGPTFSPDGSRLVWSCTSTKEGSAIFLAKSDGSDPRVELKNWSAEHFTWRPDGKAFAFSGIHTVARFNAWSDVYFHKVGGSAADPLTRNQRARDPAFSPDGRDLWVITNKVQNNQLARLSIDQDLNPVTATTDHTQLSTPRPSPDGRLLALSVWKDGIRDLWLYRPDGTPFRRVTADAAMDIQPEWSADGRTLYFSSDRTGIFNLYAIDLETEQLWQITNMLGGAFSPSPNPSGTALVYESYRAEGMDIAWMDLDRGRWIDRGTLPLPVGESHSLREALPETPITAPAPPNPPKAEADPRAQRKAAREARRQERRERRAEKHPKKPGTDAFEAVTPLAPGWESDANVSGLDGLGGPFHVLTGQPGGARPPPAVDETGSADDPNTTDAVAVDRDAEYAFSWPVKKYHPIGLFPPKYFVPSLTLTAFGTMGALSTGSVDLLRRYIYSAYVSYETDSHFLGWGASAALNRYIPILSAGVYAQTVPYGDIFVQSDPPPEGGGWVPSVESNNTRYWDKRIRGYAQIYYDLSSRRSIFARWSGTFREPLDPLPADTYIPALPTRGFLSSVGGGWRYSYGRSYGQSISPEEGRIVSLVGEWFSSTLGSYTLDDDNNPQPFNQIQLTAEWREYQSIPGLANHVLAARVASGASFGDGPRYGSFSLGGDFGESTSYTLPDEWRALRGFPSATDYGDWYYLGSLEYRFPLWWIDRGVGLIPAYARYISAAAFLDAGNAFDEAADLSNPNLLLSTRVGAGLELRGQAIILWGAGVSARLGYAFAVYGSDGYALGSLNGLYAWLGTTF